MTYLNPGQLYLLHGCALNLACALFPELDRDAASCAWVGGIHELKRIATVHVNPRYHRVV